MQSVNGGLVLGVAGALSGTIMAVLALALSRAPGWTELRSFALVSITAAAYCVFGLGHVVPASDEVVILSDMLTLAASYVYGLVWIRHFAIAARRPLKRWERRTMFIGAVLVVLALIPGVMIVRPIRHIELGWVGTTYVMATGTLLAILGVAFIVTVTILAAFTSAGRWRDGWHARIPVLGASALALTGVVDTFSSLEIIPLPQLIEAVTVIVVGALGTSYARRFIDDARRLEALSTGLEREVATRTSELLAAQAAATEHQRLADLGRLAAGVAHEINNPTAVIHYNLELLRQLLNDQGELAPEIATRLEHSRTATRRIAAIVRQLLESGRDHDLATEGAAPFLIAPVIDQAIVAATVTVPEIKVAVTCPPELCARGEPNALEQALINLLANAAHATRDVASGARICIDAERAGDRVKLRVSDNGPGIPDAIRDRIFKPFSTTKPVGQGTGLGLAVSRGLLVRHGGTLSVARSTSEGTEMLVELPAAEPVQLAAATAREVTPPATRVVTDVRVLLIEDDDDLREVLTLQLDRFFQIAQAATVDEALAMVRAERYDVVLCDVMMPNGGAETWLARSALIDPQIDARTIRMTGGPTTEAASALLRLREGKVLLKPVDISVLRPLIERTARSPSA